MKNNQRWIFLVIAIISVLSFSDSCALPIDYKGFGADAIGGKGGRIVRATNLESKGPGSFREALEMEGPRIVVFEVAGVIDLQQNEITIAEPYLTVAGQTAPSPGITIIKGGIDITTHDIIIQHIRIRPGDAGEKRLSGWEPDGITTAGAKAFNIIIDHCSFSWGIDENLSVSGPGTEGRRSTSRKVTLSNCIIAEGLNDASHSKGSHSKGSLIHDFCSEIAVIGNLYAHNVARNPYFKAHTTGVIVNNVIYNPGTHAIQLNYVPSEWESSQYAPVNPRVSIIGNVIIKGIDTKEELKMISSKGDVFLADNIAYGLDRKPLAVTIEGINILEEKPVWPNGLLVLKAAEVLDHIIDNAGARPKDRDPVDMRIISDLVNNSGRIIDSQEEVGGYPGPTMNRRQLDVPSNNIDEWLKSYLRYVEK